MADKTTLRDVFAKLDEALAIRGLGFVPQMQGKVREARDLLCAVREDLSEDAVVLMGLLEAEDGSITDESMTSLDTVCAHINDVAKLT